MSARTANRILVALSIIVIGGTGIAITALLRGEDTRNIIERSACATDPASSECQRIKREADVERAVRDTCIAFEQVVRPASLKKVTVCADKGVVNQNSPVAGVLSVPSPDGSRSTNRPVPPVQVPDGNTPGLPAPNDPPTNPVDPPVSPPVTPPATPPVTPPVTPPAPPALSTPTITLPSIDVGVGNSGACVGVGGLKVTVGTC